MTKQPRVDGKTILRLLQRAGYELDHIEGSHHYLYKEGLPGLVCVPVHGTQIISPKTFASILNQAGMTENDFVALQAKRRSKKRSSPTTEAD